MRLQTISPGLLTPFIVPPPRRKYIGGWRSLHGARIPADKVLGRNRAGDLEHPDEVVGPFIEYGPRHSARRAAWFPERRPSRVQTRLVISASSPAHSSTSLKCGSGSAFEEDRGRRRAAMTGGRSTLFSRPFDQVGGRAAGPSAPAGTECRSRRSRNRRRSASAAMYILHCSRICSSVRSVSGFGPVRNFMPRALEPLTDGARLRRRTPRASAA